MKLLKFLSLSVNESERNEDDIRTDCLHCGKGTLEINQEPPHPYQCWNCKKTGNGYTLLRSYYDQLPKMTPRDLRPLCELKKGIKIKVAKEEGIKRDPNGWIFPIRNTEGKIVCLYRYNESNNICYSTPKPFSMQLIGIENLTKTGPIYLAEGHWDYLAIKSWSDTKNILGLCGSSFPAKQLGVLENRDVNMLTDNDEAGREGVSRLASLMVRNGQKAATLSFLDWGKVNIPGMTTVPDKFDMRDLIGKLT